MLEQAIRSRSKLRIGKIPGAKAAIPASHLVVRYLQNSTLTSLSMPLSIRRDFDLCVSYPSLMHIDVAVPVFS